MEPRDLSTIRVAVQSLMKQNDKFGSFKDAKRKLQKKYPHQEMGDNATLYYNKEGNVAASTESSNLFCNAVIYHSGKDVAKDYPFNEGIVCKAESKDSDYMNYIRGDDLEHGFLIFEIYDSHRNGKIDNDDMIHISSSRAGDTFSQKITIGKLLLGYTKPNVVNKSNWLDRFKSKPKENDTAKATVPTPLEAKTERPKQQEIKPKVPPKTQKTEPKQIKPQEKQPKKVQNNQIEQTSINQNNIGINNSFNNNSGVIIIK